MIMERTFRFAIGAGAVLVSVLLVGFTLVQMHKREYIPAMPPLGCGAIPPDSHDSFAQPSRDARDVDPCNPPPPVRFCFPAVGGDHEAFEVPTPTLAPPEPPQLPPAGEVLTVRLEAELFHPRPADGE